MVSEPLAEYPFQPVRIDVGGYGMACVDEGAGPAVVMVHGNPSWSYLYRNLIADLRERYRCLAPDHIGCGQSEKPQQYPYTLEQHIENLDVLLAERRVRRCVLVVHDWGGAIGMGWAGRNPERVAGLVVFNTAAFAADRMPRRIGICRWPVIGPLLVRGCNAFAGGAVHMAVQKPMDAGRRAGFLAPYRTWHDRVALLRFVQDIPMKVTHPSWLTLQEVEAGLLRLRHLPMLLCWGGRDWCFDGSFYRQWQQRFPHAEAHFYPEAGHYLLEDALENVLAVLRPFLDGIHGTPR